MKISSARCIVACATLTALAACSGAGPQTPGFAPNVSQPAALLARVAEPDAAIAALTTREHVVPRAQNLLAHSWMSPDAKNTKYLLYVSDQVAGAVDVYAYKSKAGHMLGQLAGFKFPYGECLDASGNVFIADFGAGNIVEYAHGGDKPIKTLDDKYGYPIGCSVNPKNGNLAVANFESRGKTCMGGIVIYRNAAGKGRLFQDKDLNYYWPPAYDADGNLFVQGKKKLDGRRTGLALLAASGKDDARAKLVTIKLIGGRIDFPGGMQWDGTYMAATDQSFKGGHLSGIYRLALSNGSVKIEGTTELSDTCLKGKVPYNDVVQPWINGTARPNHAVVAGNLACDYKYNFWNYIKAGDPKRTLPYDLSPELAYGQTVSPMAR